MVAHILILNPIFIFNYKKEETIICFSIIYFLIKFCLFIFLICFASFFFFPSYIQRFIISRLVCPLSRNKYLFLKEILKNDIISRSISLYSFNSWYHIFYIFIFFSLLISLFVRLFHKTKSIEQISIV